MTDGWMEGRSDLYYPLVAESEPVEKKDKKNNDGHSPESRHFTSAHTFHSDSYSSAHDMSKRKDKGKLGYMRVAAPTTKRTMEQQWNRKRR